jgi:hypothetical protein
MPLSSRVAVPDGGKFAGIRRIVVSMPWLSSTSQNGVPRRSSSTRPLESGTCQPPTRISRPAGTVRDVERYGCIVFGSRWMKSKMPWRPGSRPVMNVDQATGLCGGLAVASDAKVPRLASLARFGSRPRAIRSRVSS